MMSRTMLYGCFALVIAGIVLGLGCPQQGASGPKTYAVTGTVMQDGKPVDGATVTFVPAGEGKSATGVTDASGKYTLTTSKAGDGAAAGQYGVKIVKYEGGEAETAAGGGGGGQEGEAGIGPEMPSDYGGAAKASEGAPTNVLPSQYESPDTSQLSATVTEDPSKNVFDFDLKGS
jgi:hypothetical protein